MPQRIGGRCNQRSKKHNSPSKRMGGREGGPAAPSEGEEGKRAQLVPHRTTRFDHNGLRGIQEMGITNLPDEGGNTMNPQLGQDRGGK